MRTVALERTTNLGPGDTVDVVLKVTLVNDTAAPQQVMGISWEPVFAGDYDDAARWPE